MSYVPDPERIETDYREELFHATSERHEGFFVLCLTGLSYIRVKTLCPAHLKDNEGGNYGYTRIT